MREPAAPRMCVGMNAIRRAIALIAVFGAVVSLASCAQLMPQVAAQNAISDAAKLLEQSLHGGDPEPILDRLGSSAAADELRSSPVASAWAGIPDADVSEPDAPSSLPATVYLVVGDRKLGVYIDAQGNWAFDTTTAMRRVTFDPDGVDALTASMSYVGVESFAALSHEADVPILFGDYDVTSKNGWDDTYVTFGSEIPVDLTSWRPEATPTPALLELAAGTVRDLADTAIAIDTTEVYYFNNRFIDVDGGSFRWAPPRNGLLTTDKITSWDTSGTTVSLTEAADGYTALVSLKGANGSPVMTITTDGLPYSSYEAGRTFLTTYASVDVTVPLSATGTGARVEAIDFPNVDTAPQ